MNFKYYSHCMAAFGLVWSKFCKYFRLIRSNLKCCKFILSPSHEMNCLNFCASHRSTSSEMFKIQNSKLVRHLFFSFYVLKVFQSYLFQHHWIHPFPAQYSFPKSTNDLHADWRDFLISTVSIWWFRSPRWTVPNTYDITIKTTVNADDEVKAKWYGTFLLTLRSGQ